MENIIQLNTKDTDLNTTFWHGTTADCLDSIFENGLDPSSTMSYDHICLTSDWKQALFWARLHQKPGIILIRVDGSKLTSARCTVETGGLDNSPYGHDRPDRSGLNLKVVADDWRGYLQATDAMGYLDSIPVQEEMICRDFYDLEKANFSDLIDEYQSGISPFADQDLRIAA